MLRKFENVKIMDNCINANANPRNLRYSERYQNLLNLILKNAQKIKTDMLDILANPSPTTEDLQSYSLYLENLKTL